MSTTTVSYYPRPLSSLVAVGMALAVVGVLVRTETVWAALVGHTFGLLLLAIGIAWCYRRDRVIVATLIALVGVAISALAIAFLIAIGARQSLLLVVIPGMIGAQLLVFGLFPIEDRGSRALVKSGAGCLIVSVLIAGLFHAPAVILLASAVGVVVVWDAAEHAIDVGEQLGNQARTFDIEVTHVSGTLIVGAIAFPTALFVSGFGPSGLSLSQFVVLIGAALLFTLALHE